MCNYSHVGIEGSIGVPPDRSYTRICRAGLSCPVFGLAVEGERAFLTYKSIVIAFSSFSVLRWVSVIAE